MINCSNLKQNLVLHRDHREPQGNLLAPLLSCQRSSTNLGEAKLSDAVAEVASDADAAISDCALSAASVKVGCHTANDPGCGKLGGVSP